MPSVKSQARTTKPTIDVLTLQEAADYLRISADVLLQMAVDGKIPARQLGKEWRFFKPALQDWLRGTTTYKQQILAMAGAWKDDPTLDEMLKEIYRKRGRPMTEDGE